MARVEFEYRIPNNDILFSNLNISIIYNGHETKTIAYKKTKFSNKLYITKEYIVVDYNHELIRDNKISSIYSDYFSQCTLFTSDIEDILILTSNFCTNGINEFIPKWTSLNKGKNLYLIWINNETHFTIKILSIIKSY